MSAAAVRAPYVETRTPYVYRLFDADGDLLYIGSSINPGARFTRHKAEQPWWPQVASWALEARSSLDEARTAEQLAIAAEHPRHNKRGHGPTPVRNFRALDGEWVRAQDKAAAEGRTLTDVIVAYLKRYTSTPPRKPKGRASEPA